MTIEHNIMYRMEGFTVNVTQRQIITPQQTLNVRPKTFSLLLQFLGNPLQVLSKDFLLDTIWDDVTVEEQVLVQSIRELRQLFSPLNVIQTHPRKGYAWIIPVEKLNHCMVSTPVATDVIPITIGPTPLEPPLRVNKKLPIALAMFGVVVLFVLGAFALKDYVLSEPIRKNIITVLPIDNRTEGSNMRWVQLGMADQLIQSLQVSPDMQVFDVPYVLHLLEVSGVDAANRLQLVKRIFEISGSSLVVDLELSGSVNDYRLLYRLYTRTDQSSGVVIENNLDKLVENLARVIATKTQTHLDFKHLHAEFNSSLLAEAVEQWNQGQAVAAITLLQTAITLEPNNFLAHQLLIEYQLQHNDWLGAAANARNIIPLADQQGFAKTYIFYYLLATAEWAQGNLAQVRHSLPVAQTLAEGAFDSLYQAYIATLWGDIAMKEGDMGLAEAAYQRAMGHHQSIACPIGVSMVHLKLIDLYASQARDADASAKLGLLKALAERHHLPVVLPGVSNSHAK